jgi:superfamily I DNA and/or RNA helicase
VIGDVHQLEPVIGLSEEDERRILRGMRLGIASARLAPYRTHDESQSSAQSLADAAVSTRPTLIDHFRCQPAIAAICERLCGYGLITRTQFMSRSDRAPVLSAPVLFVPLAGEQERQGGSWMNPLEIAHVVQWVQHLIQQGINPDEIGVITPFRGQLDALWRELAAARVPLDQPGQPQEVDNNLDLFGATPGRGLSLGTVHRFQGGEKSIILFSTTVTRPSSLRFIDQRVNLINVAASRARDHLITLGHEPTLREGQYTRALLADARALTQWELPFSSAG